LLAAILVDGLPEGSAAGTPLLLSATAGNAALVKILASRGAQVCSTAQRL
jgi:hypothetical protein